MSVTIMGGFIQAFLVLSSFFIFAIGCAILGVGIWTITSKQLVATYIYFNVDAVIIAAGAVILLIGLVMLIAVKKEVKCIIFLGALFTLALAVLIIVGVIAIYIFRDQVDEHNRRELVAAVAMWDTHPLVKDGWEALQKFLGCCGLKQEKNPDTSPYRIWGLSTQEFKDGAITVPKSCCLINNSTGEPMDCQKSPLSTNSYRDHDCYDSFIDFIRNHAMLIGGVLAGSASILTLYATLLFSLLCLIE